MIPSIATMVLLVKFFSYTGLGRIMSIPATLFLNITFFILILNFKRKIIIEGIQMFNLDYSRINKRIIGDCLTSPGIFAERFNTMMKKK
jgi:hypothetical protein